MKRNIFLVLLLLFTIVCAYGQNSSPIDLVLLLDTSSSMSSSYDNVNNYVTGAFLNEFLRVGDTFHLIAFSGNPRLDVARRISGVGDVETIIGRMLLQYPVENGSNISSALNFAEQYINTLPSRPKKIVLVSVGGADTNNLVTASKQRLNSKNTTLDFIQVTPGSAITNAPKSGRPAGTTNITGTTGAGGSASSAGTSSQTQGTAGTGSASTQGGGRTATGTQDTGRTTTTGTTATGSGGASTSGGTTTTTGTGAGTGSTDQQSGGPSSTSTGGTSGGTSQDGTPYEGTSQDGTTYGDNNSTDRVAKSYISEEERARRSESYYTSMPFIILVVILLLLLLGIIIFLASRKLGSRPNRVMAEVASAPQTEESTSPNPRDHMKFVDHSKDLAKYASTQGGRRTTPYDNHPLKPDTHKSPVINPSGPLLLNLFVEDQNTMIGKRNIHSLKSGYSLSVGGSKSDDYYVFLVPVPGHLGEIRRDGSSLTFIPRKAKYFPDIGSNPVKDCINKTIRIVSDKNYEMRFRFEMYEDPLVALNRVLMSVKVPG
jgi:hypothetical protein